MENNNQSFPTQRKKINEDENSIISNQVENINYPIHRRHIQYPTYNYNLINVHNYDNNQLPPVVFNNNNAPNNLPLPTPISMISPAVHTINVHDNHLPLLLTNGDYNNVAAASSSTSIKLRNCWTQEEHKLFLIGLLVYKKGDWRSISDHVVKSRTSTQVASHAQKYYIHINGDQKKKPSIHDTELSNTDLQLICRVIAALDHATQQQLLQMLLLQNQNGLQAQQTQQQQIIKLVAQHLLQMHQRQVQQRLQEMRPAQNLSQMQQHLQQETMQQQQAQQPWQEMQQQQAQQMQIMQQQQQQAQQIQMQQLQQLAPQVQMQQQAQQIQMQQQQPQQLAPQVQMQQQTPQIQMQQQQQQQQVQQQFQEMQLQQQQAQQMQMQQSPLNPPNNMANQFGQFGHFNNRFGQYYNNGF